MWYINKKTNELVQAIWLGEGAWANNCWGVRDKDDNWLGYLKDTDFQSLYGEAMVNSPMIPADDKPHIKDKFCDNLGCIPYIPEQKQADEEPVFPVCGTCNARKDAYLLLPPEKIRDILQTGGTPEDFSIEIAKAELDHLAKPEMEIYKKIICEYYMKCRCTLSPKQLCPRPVSGCYEYIPLSDYMKGEGK